MRGDDVLALNPACHSLFADCLARSKAGTREKYIRIRASARVRFNAGWTLTLASWIFLAVGAAAEPMGPPPPPEKWSAAEVEAGRADCGKRLSGLHVRF
jgi:hypothetical protein